MNAAAATRSTWREIAAVPALPAAIMLALAGFRFAEPAAWLARKAGGGDVTAGAALRNCEEMLAQDDVEGWLLGCSSRSN